MEGSKNVSIIGIRKKNMLEVKMECPLPVMMVGTTIKRSDQEYGRTKGLMDSPHLKNASALRSGNSSPISRIEDRGVQSPTIGT
jgi:hypothetical protein